MGMFNWIKSNVPLPKIGKTDLSFILKDKEFDPYPTMDTYLIDIDRKLYKEYDGIDLFEGNYYKLLHTPINYTGKLKFHHHSYKSNKLPSIYFTAIFEEGELICVEIETVKHDAP